MAGGTSVLRKIAKKNLSPEFQNKLRTYIRQFSSLKSYSNIPEYYYINSHKKIRLDKDIPGFSKLASEVIKQNRTYLNFDRLYSIWQALLEVGSDSIVIEVGAYKGGSSKFISEALGYLKKPNTLYVCDTFSGHASVDQSVDGQHEVSKGFSDVTADEVKAYLSSNHNAKVVVGSIMDTASELPNKPVGMIHIDVDVYPATKFCLEHFCPRLERGGIAVVDDYGFTTCVGAKKAVDEFIKANKDFRCFHLTSGQALVIKV